MAAIDFGLGLRPEHYEEIAASPGRVSWFEALSENYMVPGGGPVYWLERIRRLVTAATEKTGTGDLLVYMQITRGVAPRDHVMPAQIVPTVFMMANPMKPPSAEQRQKGVACVTARDFRWERGDIKSVSLLGNVLARQISADAGATETIMFRDGHLTEAAASNVWIVRDGALFGQVALEDGQMSLGIEGIGEGADHVLIGRASGIERDFAELRAELRRETLTVMRNYREYEKAANEMFERTDHKLAPWDLISGEQKRWARVEAVETLIRRVEEGMTRWGVPIPDPE